MTATKRPLCPQCRDTAGWLEDEDGNITGRCPCRYTDPSPEQARDEGMAATVEANPDAMRAALRIIRETALSQPVFNSNATRPRMKLAQIPGQVIGAAYRQALKDRVIRRIGYVPSTDPGTHAHPVAEYESLIYRAHGGVA